MTPRKEKALQALIVSRTRAEAAAAAGIGESTLREYMKDSEFQVQYRRAVSSMLEDATRQAQQAIAPALSCLREIVVDREAGAQVRIQAARSVLEYALKFTEQIDIFNRIEALEATLDGEGKK